MTDTNKELAEQYAHEAKALLKGHGERAGRCSICYERWPCDLMSMSSYVAELAEMIGES